MNRFSTALALITLGAAGVAAAQNMPSQSTAPAGTTPPPAYPSSSAPSESQARSDSADTKAAEKQQIKDCVAQQKANNSTMSKHELKKYCKNQVESAPSSTPHN